MKVHKMNIDKLCKKITFYSDGLRLSGTLHLPVVASAPPVVIGSHGLFSNSNSPKQIELANKCNACKIAYFRFDHRGCGNSEGDFDQVTSFKGRCHDMINAIKIIMARDDTAGQISLFGSSFGGAVCVSMGDLFNIASIVTFAAPVLLSKSILKAVDYAAKASPFGIANTEKKINFDISSILSKTSNILLFHGDADDVVPFSDAMKIYKKAEWPKKLIKQIRGDHMMGNKQHQKEFSREAVIWFKKGFESNNKSAYTV